MNDEGNLAIRTTGLRKSYGPVRAVVDVNLQVRRGEIYAFLGRNGAGKTTTIRMLLITDERARPSRIAQALVEAGVGLQRLAPVVEDLEQHFMRLTGGGAA